MYVHSSYIQPHILIRNDAMGLTKDYREFFENHTGFKHSKYMQGSTE